MAMPGNTQRNKSMGILLCNLGTPNSPRVADVRKYLAEFLWDPRVVKLWRPLWWLILNIVILNTRPKKSAEAYRKIWTEKGSPLLAISRLQADALKSRFKENPVELGMRYGEPSLHSAIDKLKQAGASKIVVLGLYPQFSHTTTSSVQDEVTRVIALYGNGLSYRLIKDYHDDKNYISALSESIRSHWKEHGQAEKLLMSFHGIPREYAEDGDPYPDQCRITAQLLAESLNLEAEQWYLSFQSRLGPREWLQPYTDNILQQWSDEGVTSVQVVCPGFSTDCLETLEEIAMENRKLFLEAGGKEYSYIPCLNASEHHVDMMAHLIDNQLMEIEPQDKQIP